MAERHLAGVAADDVPGHAQLRGHQHQDREVQVRRVDKSRERQRDGQARGRKCELLHALPMRPCGRNIRTPRKSTSTIASLYCGPRRRPPITSITPTRMPAMNAPVTLPKPPRLTTTNASRMKVAPTSGKIGKNVASRPPAAPAQAAPMPP